MASRAIAYCGTPEFWQKWHRAWAIIWLCNIPVAVATGLKNSLSYLIFVSLMTAFSGEMAAYHGTRTEIKQDG